MFQLLRQPIRTKLSSERLLWQRTNWPLEMQTDLACFFPPRNPRRSWQSLKIIPIWPARQAKVRQISRVTLEIPLSEYPRLMSIQHTKPRNCGNLSASAQLYTARYTNCYKLLLSQHYKQKGNLEGWRMAVRLLRTIYLSKRPLERRLQSPAAS